MKDKKPWNDAVQYFRYVKKMILRESTVYQKGKKRAETPPKTCISQ